MQKTTLRAMTLFTLLTLPPAVLAGSTTYDIVNYPDYQDGWNLSGTITTDGIIGLLQSSDITSWTWTVTMSGSSQTYRSTDPGATTIVDGLTATNTGQLILIPTTVNTYEIILATSGQHPGFLTDTYGYFYGPFELTYGTEAGVIALEQYYWAVVHYPVPVPLEEFTFATTTAVPEPSTLYLLGFGAVCGSAYVMGHKRRARRTATTAA